MSPQHTKGLCPATLGSGAPHSGSSPSCRSLTVPGAGQGTARGGGRAGGPWGAEGDVPGTPQGSSGVLDTAVTFGKRDLGGGCDGETFLRQKNL